MKLIIIDDHKLFGESLSRALLDNDAISICDFVSEEALLFKKIQSNIYDIIIVDINLKSITLRTGFDILRLIKERKPEQKVVILSAYDLPLYEKKALDNGASDFITKSIEIGDLVIRLQFVINGKHRNYTNNVDSLTERECEILLEICKGKVKKEIARELYISERTLYNHIQNIYDKLQVSNTIEAYNKAIELGYIEPLM